jgi:hypothetical protein
MVMVVIVDCSNEKEERRRKKIHNLFFKTLALRFGK